MSDTRVESFSLGRCTPDKGMHLAIDATVAAGREIELAAKCSAPAEHACFEAENKPRLGPGVEWLGEVTGERKKELPARARCLLFPLPWEEPFGRVMIEAMTCGTPVVTLRRGSIPEVVVDGVTALVRDDVTELPEAVEAVGALDPRACREHVVAHVQPETMAAGHEAVYRKVIDAAAGPGPIAPRSVEPVREAMLPAA
ncbi:glycosyltransferase [Streptomyces sp. NPDC014802]|uniref:glycosyltransferase n=1 Tax=Streptomyces sp. NPDC014802 TaxID=3364917 RepID=UPI003701D204